VDFLGIAHQHNSAQVRHATRRLPLFRVSIPVSVGVFGLLV
jgi:hypothetical protein